MSLIEELLATLPDGQVNDVRIGLHWTAVVVTVNGQRQCGLASTLGGSHEHTGEPDVPQAGHLHTFAALELARFACEPHPVLRSIGVAALNALLPRTPERWSDLNAEEILTEWGRGRTVALVGRFPFIPRLREQASRLIVLEQQPHDDERPAEEAASILPEADVVAITGMTFVNHTLEGLLALCPPQAQILVLGPSTPLSPLLGRYGVAMLSGAVVEAVEPVLRTIEQGGTFRQIHRAGVRLVTMRCAAGAS
jgi:uncharacterized protein (DUF4213/DUF364 family)